MPLSALLLAALAATVGGPPPEGSADESQRFAASSNAFGLDLYAHLRATRGNLAVSPASLATGLAMTWGGARGETAARMKAVLHFDGSPAAVMGASGRLAAALQDPAQPVVFRIANRLFGEKTFRFEPAFLEATGAAYGASLEAVDFKGAAEAARGRINRWVEDQTEKRIRDLIPMGGVNGGTRLVLTNAIYFLGDWEEPFKKEATRPAPFSTSPRERKEVPTMHRQESLPLAQGQGWKALQLAYQGGRFSMLLVLPEAVDGIDALEKSLTLTQLEGMVRALSPTLVAVALPKFEVNPSGALALGPVLASMGMALAFDPERADFTAIANPADPRERLSVGDVFHKAFVKVDEKGTEAAAATAVVMRAAGAAAPVAQPVPFTADHPFLFFIRDNPSGQVLFMGRVADPSVH